MAQNAPHTGRKARAKDPHGGAARGLSAREPRRGRKAKRKGR